MQHVNVLALLQKAIRAGSNITITPDAMGLIIASVGGGGGGGGGAGAIFDLVESHDFGSAATSYTFSNLDGDVDELYFLAFKMVKGVVATCLYTAQPNGLTTNQLTEGSYSGTAVGTYARSGLEFAGNGSAATGGVETGTLWLDSKTGTRRSGRSTRTQTDGATLIAVDTAMHWDETVTKITSLVVACDQANGIGAGSYARLYKLRKVAVPATAPLARTFMLMGA